MQAIDTIGSFWLPDSDDLAVYGRLVFDPIDGIILTTAEGIAEVLPAGGNRGLWGGTPDRIFGSIRQGGQQVAVTLIDSIWLSQTRYRVNRLLVGGRFTVDDTSFQQAVIRLSDLPAWVAQDALTVEVGDDLDGVERRELRVDLDRPKRPVRP